MTACVSGTKDTTVTDDKTAVKYTSGTGWTKTVTLTQQKEGWQDKFEFPTNLSSASGASKVAATNTTTATITVSDSGVATINVVLTQESSSN